MVIRHYEHLGKGIDYGEVERVKRALTEACEEVVAAERTDSPVYTFLRSLKPPASQAVAEAEAANAQAQTEQALAHVSDEHEKAALTTPLASFDACRDGRARRLPFQRRPRYSSRCCAVQGQQASEFVVQQLALATYKEKDPLQAPRRPRGA